MPFFCGKCKKKNTCKELCKRLERHLKGLERYQREYLTGDIDKLQENILKRKTGRKYPVIYTDNYEAE